MCSFRIGFHTIDSEDEPHKYPYGTFRHVFIFGSKCSVRYVFVGIEVKGIPFNSIGSFGSGTEAILSRYTTFKRFG